MGGDDVHREKLGASSRSGGQTHRYPWQFKQCFSIELIVEWPGVNHPIIVTFPGWEPNHHCHLASGQDVTESIPSDNGGGRLSKCSMYINSSIGDYNVSDCKNGWTYENQGYFTIVEQVNRSRRAFVCFSTLGQQCKDHLFRERAWWPPIFIPFSHETACHLYLGRILWNRSNSLSILG